ncbi:restriction modification system DNA specificity domain protein [gamma proteobacterium NOR5-3]|nr:restriction modification system DNA specificity domain protein [gamma proteobacterium NOR5-3]
MSGPAQLLVDHLDIWTGAMERKSGSGRGNGGKIGLYGIDKLRSLILDLAVRGKLVPQDPVDGDVGELVPKIEAAAKKLIAKKAIRGASNCEPLPKDQHWYELPLSWQWIALGSCTNYGYSDKTDGTDLGPDTWVLELEDVEKGTSRLLQKVRFEDRPFQSSKSMFEAGDVIYGKLRPYLDKVIVADEGGVCTTEMIPVRGHFGIDPRYLRLFLKSPHFVQYASSSVHGMNLPRLGTPKAREAPFPLPPLAEQKRIVAKVDELMTLADALEAGTRAGMATHETLVRELLAILVNSQDAHDLAQNWSRIETHFDTLFTTEESIDALKQNIVDLGVRGMLCAQDRTEDSSNQKKLRADRDAENFDLDAFEKRAALFRLPPGWTIEPLSRVSSNIVDCPHTTPKWTDDGEICVKSDQIFAGHLDLSKPNYVSEDTYIERIARLEPREGDILYKREGGILGIGARIPAETKLCLGQRLMLIRANQAVLPPFLELVINSPWLQEFAKQKTTGGAAPRVNMTVVRAYPVPIPAIREQERILQRVDELFQLCERASKSLADLAGLEIKLSDAITASAA